jgi:hypothetical protein
MSATARDRERNAANAVSAHLRHAAVGVDDVHSRVMGGIFGGQYQNNAVGADPEVPIAKAFGERRRNCVDASCVDQ